MSTSARDIVKDVLTKQVTDEIWSLSCEMVLPITFNNFDLSAVLPAVFYMFRFGHRRGPGKFLDAFAPHPGTRAEKRKAVSIDRVARKLAESPNFSGFGQKTETEILGDLLLCHCLGNLNHEQGRDAVIMRVVPAHFFSSWIDLPGSVAHVRFVPEMIVAMLANQDGQNVLDVEDKNSAQFPIGKGHEKNPLLRAFNQGIKPARFASDLTGDKFEEEYDGVGIDQLLMIRLAQFVGEPPGGLRTSGGVSRISNQHPISRVVASNFSEDLRNFVASYSDTIPRRTFVDLLETCLSIGIGTVFIGAGEMMLDWSITGRLPDVSTQRATKVFVDCSNGVDRSLRDVAEQSLDDLLRRFNRLPEVLMTARLLDSFAKDNSKLREYRATTRPYATDWVNLLGNLLHARHEEADYIHRQLREKSERLAIALDKSHPAEASVLRNEKGEENPVRRLAAALALLQGRETRKKWPQALDCALNLGRPNGLVLKRSTRRGASATGKRTRTVRSCVLPDAALDYLVHLHLLQNGDRHGTHSLSLADFLKDIRERHGFHVDEEPPHMSISNDLLRANKAKLERRLRDLGLLIGVNDSESMKRVTPRFKSQGGR